MSSVPSFLLPLRKPVEKIWGGDALCRWLDIDRAGIGETWEVFDRGNGSSSPLANDSLGGETLAELLRRERSAVLGSARLDALGRFPVMLKLLDANDRLSLQVHPDAQLARQLAVEDGGKSEAWVVLRAKSGAELVRGLRPGVSADELFAAIRDNRALEPYFETLCVRPRDVIDIPAGTLHSVGAGMVLYEIQENSDVTLRLHDWGRVGTDGRPRPLHLKEGRLALRDFPANGCVEPVDEGEGVELLIDNDVFALRRIAIERPRTLRTDECCHLLTVTEGSVVLRARGEELAIDAGDTCIVTGQVAQVEVGTSSRSECLWVRPANR